MHVRGLLVVSMLVAGPAAAQTVQTVINGNVFASPQAVIKVEAYDANGLLAGPTTPGAGGHYTLPVQSGGTYRVLAYDETGTYATSYYSNASSFDTSAQLNLTASLSGVDFEMVKGFKVSGNVVFASAGTPLSGMVVAAYNADGSRRGFTKTDANGAFGLVVPPGTYRFASYDENAKYATSFYSGQSSFEAALQVPVSADRALADFRLPLAASVAGSAVDRGTRAPLASLTVAAHEPDGALVYSTTTGADGRFAMALAPGAYKFVAFDDLKHYVVSYYSDAGSFASAPSFPLAAGQPLSVDFLMSPVPPPNSRTTIFVPAAVNVSGVGGAHFQTDVWVTNTSASPIALTVTYLPAGQDNSNRPGKALSLGAHSQVAIANVLDNLFQTAGAGALKLDSDAPFLATSRTYNNASSAGTFGVGIAGRPLSASVSRGIILGLSNNASYRSNVAVMNPQPVPVTVTFQLYRADGTALGQGIQTLAPLDWYQANTIFSFLGVDSAEDNAYVTVSSPDGSFFSYGSVVDQRSTDGTVIEAVGY